MGNVSFVAISLWVTTLRSRSPLYMIVPIILVILLFAPFTFPALSRAADQAVIRTVQHIARPSPFVGSAMALLATLEQAQVLPPEGTKDADRVIQAVIQFQSALTKSTDAQLQDFLRAAIARKQEAHAEEIIERFRTTGWTSDVLEALAEIEQQASPETLQQLKPGLAPFNLSPDDFSRLMRLVRDGQAAFAAQGQSFREAYTTHRSKMPGQK